MSMPVVSGWSAGPKEIIGNVTKVNNLAFKTKSWKYPNYLMF